MKTLSWLLYAADVVPGIGRALGLLGLLAGMGWVIWSIVQAFWISENDDDYTRDRHPERYARAQAALAASGYTAPPRFLIVPAALLVLSTLVPSRETILLIAGSEAGEAVVMSEAGRETLTLVQDALKAQLRELAGDTE